MIESSREQKIIKLLEIVAGDPAAAEFVELAQLLGEDPVRRGEAREVCFRGLTKDPTALRGRLVLARLFYLDEMMEFCARELAVLNDHAPGIPELDRLLEALGKRYTAAGTIGQQKEERRSEEKSKVVAEVNLDEDFISILDELEQEEQK